MNIWLNYSTNNRTNWLTNIPISQNTEGNKNCAITDDVPSSSYYGRTNVTWIRFTSSSGYIYFSYTDGIYFYRLEEEGFVDNKKMLLVK